MSAAEYAVVNQPSDSFDLPKDGEFVVKRKIRYTTHSQLRAWGV
jgi:hypothetical protein